MQCGAFTALLAVSAIAGGLLAFKKLRFIYLFPERLHSKLKWLHRNVSKLYMVVLVPTDTAGANTQHANCAAWPIDLSFSAYNHRGCTDTHCGVQGKPLSKQC